MSAPLVRAAEARDLEIVARMLAAAALPTEDLTAEHLALVAENEGTVVAAIGLEQFGSVGLLRSLVVDETARGAGLGQRLVTALERHALQRGVQQLWLLTIDADGFFDSLGYERESRSAAPAAIGETEEFASLCPDDAVLMKKAL